MEEKRFQVFVTERNSHLSDDKGGGFVTMPVSGVHTEKTARGYMEFLKATQKTHSHGYPREYFVKEVR